MIRYLLALVLLFTATPAHAGPLAAVIPIVVGALVKTAIVKIALTIALTVAVSMLTKAMQKKPIPPGIQIERRLSGGTVSRTILLGWYATAGSEVSPAMSFGKVNKTPNSYLHSVTALADVPIDSLRRLVVNGEYVPFNASVNDGDGHPLGGKYSGRGWVKFYDGRQLAADPRLRSVYANYLRPWDAGKIGKGVSYAILTWLFDAELFRGEPEVKFEVYGMRLYDPRKDGSIGGVGTHRFNDPSTHEFTMNPMVMVYNILRGITFVDGSKYGGECLPYDLPLDNWSAAMNVCDEQVTTSNGTEARYRAGFEIPVAEMEPADAIEELLKTCSGDIVETGGIYKTRCGPPSLPIMFVTDADFLVSQASDFDPFRGIASAKNTIYATYPSPDENWSQHDAPVQTDAEYLSRDQGIVLSGSLSLPAVPFPLQVQRLMAAWLKDDQRWRQHSASFGHYGFILEPLDCIAWSSARNQYDNKLFEVNSCDENLATLTNTVALREVDPSDYNYRVTDELPDPVVPGNWELPPVQAVPGFGADAATVKDAQGKDRRPAIRVYWDADAADDADFIKIQVRVGDQGNATIDVTANIVDGSRLLVEGLLPATAYQVRGKFIADRPTEWTTWIDVATPDVRLSNQDISAEFDADLSDVLDRIDQAERDIEAVEAVGTALQAKATQLELDFQQAGRDIAALGGDVSTLESTVASQGASISTNATAISNVAGNLSSLTTRVSASNPNMMREPSFERGVGAGTDWNPEFGFWTSANSLEVGQYGTSFGPNARVYTNAYPIANGRTYTISADVANFTDVNAVMQVYGFDEQSDQPLGLIASVEKASGDFSKGSEDGRVKLTFSTPAGSPVRRVKFAFHVPNGAGQIAIRRVKFEGGSVMTTYSGEASILQTFTAISTLNGQYASLSSTVSTLGSSVSQNATAISTLTTQTASLSFAVAASAVGLVANPNFAVWPADSYYPSYWSGWSTQPALQRINSRWASAGYAARFTVVANGANTGFAQGGHSGVSPIGAGGGWFVMEAEIELISGDLTNVGLTADGVYNFYFATEADTSGAIGTAITGRKRSFSKLFFAPATINNFHVMAAWTPFSGVANTAKVIDWFYANIRAATQDEIDLNKPLGFKAQVTQQAQAITDLSGQYASLSSTVSTQGTLVSQQATAISTLNTNYASLSSTVSTQGGSITQNANAISNLSGTVSSLSSTVSAQGASISQNATAISGVAGNVTTLFARVAVSLDVNGYITGWEANNNGSFGDFTIRADRFRIISPTGGLRTEYSGGNWRAHDEQGRMKMRWGVIA